MGAADATEPRDPARPAEYYERFAAAEEKTIARYRDGGRPRLFTHLPPLYVRLAAALYSAGASPPDVRQALAGAAEYEERYIREGREYHDDAYREMEEYLEICGAALLSGQGPALAQAFLATTFEEPPLPGHELIMRQLCALMQGTAMPPSPARLAGVKGLSGGWATLPPLLTSTAGRSSEFGPSLEAFLSELWGPMMEKWARGALKAEEPKYCGKWSFLAGALCDRVGVIPELTPAARWYVPADLVGASGGRSDPRR